MAPFDRPCTTFYWTAIANIHVALSGTVFELFDVEYYRDLEIWVKGHSRSATFPLPLYAAILHILSYTALKLPMVEKQPNIQHIWVYRDAPGDNRPNFSFLKALFALVLSRD